MDKSLSSGKRAQIGSHWLRHSRWSLAAAFVAVLLAGNAGCAGMLGISAINDTLKDTNIELRNTIRSFDQAIADLSQQSADWQVVLQELEESLMEDIQSTIRVEVTNLLRTSVLAAGAEIRCDAEYLRLRVERELTRIRNDLAQTLNGLGLNPPIPLLPIADPEPFVCSATPVAVDMSLAEDRRSTLELYGFDLRSAPITAELVSGVGGRRDISGHVNLISDFVMVLDMSAGGAAPDDTSRRVELTWSGAVQSSIPVIVPGRSVACSVKEYFVAGTIGSFLPEHTRGDKDFAGNGPCVQVNGELRIVDGDRAIEAELTMKAFECNDNFDQPKSDHTTASGTTTFELFRVTDASSRILGHNLDPTFSYEYIDTNHNHDIKSMGGTQMIEKIRFIGDTSGDEAGSKTRMEEIHFRNMKVRVEECSE